MKKSLSEYLSMPGYTNLSKETRKLMPILEDPYDYIMNGDIVVNHIQIYVEHGNLNLICRLFILLNIPSKY